MDDALESVFKENVVESFNLTVVNVTNTSELCQVQQEFDLYEVYRSREKEQLIMYQWIALVLGVLIIISNLTVVISSGLILRKGQQHKSTYLLLGNVSLADTIIGISILFGSSFNNRSLSSNQLCIFQLGMLVCPAIVSIFSVGLIAVDRYIYILHGLYYQRWFNTTRVRIGIVCIWMIGVSLGFMPSAGWVNRELICSSRCQYSLVYPGPLILFNSILSTIPIFIVAILYTIILVHALKNFKNIKFTEKSVRASSPNLESLDKPKLRINRGHSKLSNVNQNPKFYVNNKCPLKRSASFCMNESFISREGTGLPKKSKSIDDLSPKTKPLDSSLVHVNNSRDSRQSNFSVYTVTSSYSSETTTDKEDTPNKKMKDAGSLRCTSKNNTKTKGPNKWRGVAIVMLTSFSFIICWLPFFIIAIGFVFCEEKRINPKCVQMRSYLAGPLAILAFVNSLLNPLIYAWWHKGFKKSLKNYFRKVCQNYFFNRRSDCRTATICRLVNIKKTQV